MRVENGFIPDFNPKPASLNLSQVAVERAHRLPEISSGVRE